MCDPMTYYQDQVDLWKSELSGCTTDHERRLVTEMIRDLERKNASYQQVMFALLEQGEGLTLQRPGCDQWALCLSDASNPGKKRYQVFDRSGFLSHSTFNTLEEAVLDAFQAGFTQLGSQETLVEVSSTEEWARGSIAGALIQKINAGLLTHKQAEEQFRQQSHAA